jgi:sulfonate transport system substrate-binding protein
MDKTFAKLGWAVPKQPPFIPAGWKGDPAKPPYPDYMQAINTSAPQAFPERGDLTRAWMFAGQTYAP